MQVGGFSRALRLSYWYRASNHWTSQDQSLEAVKYGFPKSDRCDRDTKNDREKTGRPYLSNCQRRSVLLTAYPEYSHGGIIYTKKILKYMLDMYIVQHNFLGEG